MASATGESATASSKKKAKADAKSKAAFSTRTARTMQIEYLGEGTPGPGAYLPASTFGKFDKSAEKQKQRNRPTSSFKSTSPSRPRTVNEHVPGPGAHTPSYMATSSVKKLTNPGASMKSKTKRFGGAVGTTDTADKNKAREPGPGDYNSHNAKTIATYLAKKRERMSRQNPGFGASSAAHTLPFETDINEDQKAFREVASTGGADSFVMGGAGKGSRKSVIGGMDHLSA